MGIQEPVYKIPHWMTTGRFLLGLYWLPIYAVFGLYAFLTLTSGEFLYLIYLVFVVFGAGIFFFRLSRYRRSRRVEFYEQFARITPHFGQAVEAPYSELVLQTEQWKNITIGKISQKGTGKKLVAITDRRVVGLNITLLQWLAAKIIQAEAE